MICIEKDELHEIREQESEIHKCHHIHNNREVPPIRFIEIYLAAAAEEAEKQSPHKYK